MAPGCGDAITARLVESTGFEAAYVSGLWTAASLGFQDYGIATMNEMLANAAYIVRSVSIPIVADIDSGFGSHLNVRRCIEEFEHAGVAAVHLEDQRLPKKCGLMPGKEVVSTEEMAEKVESAVAGRRDPDLLLVVKTDALAGEGLDATLARGHAYFEAGADMLFVEAISNAEEAHVIAEEFAGKYLLFSVAANGYGPEVQLEDIKKWGYQLIKYPVHILLAGLMTQREVLLKLREDGSFTSSSDRMLNLHELFELLGNVEAHALT
jgi:2-methylisocitrate lyase-like PEP mutase family enzyme